MHEHLCLETQIKTTKFYNKNAISDGCSTVGAYGLVRGTQKILNKDMLRRGYVKFAVALVVVQAMPHSMSISIHTLSKRHCCLYQLESHLEMPLVGKHPQVKLNMKII